MAKSSTIISVFVVYLSLGIAQTLPQVDLGYQIQQAVAYNPSYSYYNFSNIRYAQPPIGDLRFAAPIPPEGRNNTVTDGGALGSICPQGQASWVPVAFSYSTAILTNKTSSFNLTQTEEVILNTPFDELPSESPRGTELPPRDPRETEDCLFLDVMVPKSVFNNAGNKTSKGAPVVIWMFGGGYVIGSKYDFDPRGILKVGAGKGEGIIYVAMNYRLGAFGWLSGPTFEAAGGISNVGFYDQRLAFEWVQKYIHLFGGNPHMVTINGESAGACSIINHLTANGGEKHPPFRRALANSAGVIQTYSNEVVEHITQGFLSQANVTTIEQARNESSQTLILANAQQIATSDYGLFQYNPVPDGKFVRKLPSLALLAGQFSKHVDVFYTNTQNEGILFVPPYIQKESDVKPWLITVYPTIQDEIVDYIQKVLYPPVYNGTEEYSNLPERIAVIIRDMAVSCNGHYLAKATKGRSYSWRFDVGPSLHGGDGPYIQWDGMSPTNVSQSFYAPLAQQVQEYFVNFIQTGDPNGAGLPPFPNQGTNSSANLVTPNGFITHHDPEDSVRCDFWAKALGS